MKITTETKLWIVIDPTPVSEMADIFFQADMRGLERIIVGSLPERMTDKNMTIYTKESEASLDAIERLDSRP